MQKITAFVARSFAAQDDEKIQPILEHLDSFRDLGFVWKSAEPAEVERVSAKVRRIISECEVFVGILTKKYPVYGITSRLKDALKLARNRLDPTRWTAPAWVVQESGFALALDKKLILFVEPDLDLPFLQGDLECIPYLHTNPVDAFRRASEMINNLIAKQAGIKVETVVREEPREQGRAREANTSTRTQGSA